MSKRALIIAAALAVSAAGCEEALGPDEDLGVQEVAELSDALIQEVLAETADTSTTSTLADGLALSQVTATIEFIRTRTCPLGGEVIMSGTRTRTRDTETRTGTMDVSATRTFVDCVRPLADSTVTVTLAGDVTLAAHREWQAGQWHGAQEVTLSGSVDWATSDDRAGTCVIDVQAAFDPETRERTVTGTVCDEDASELRGWTFGIAQHGPGHREPGHMSGTGGGNRGGGMHGGG